MPVHSFLRELRMWTTKVWLRDHGLPSVEDGGLAAFDILRLIPRFRERYAADRTVTRQAATLEQMYLHLQLAYHQEVMALIAAPYLDQATERVRERTILRPHEILRLLHSHYCVTQVSSRLSCLTYDGVTGHAITIHGVHPALDAFEFYDPWGARSLLCRENNHAGLDAAPVPGQPMMWLLPAGGLAAVTVAVFVPMPLWRFWQQVEAEEPGLASTVSITLTRLRHEYLDRLARGEDDGTGPPMVKSRYPPDLIHQILPHPDPELYLVDEVSSVAAASEPVPGPATGRVECRFADLLRDRGLPEEAQRWYRRARDHGDRVAREER